MPPLTSDNCIGPSTCDYSHVIMSPMVDNRLFNLANELNVWHGGVPTHTLAASILVCQTVTLIDVINVTLPRIITYLLVNFEGHVCQVRMVIHLVLNALKCIEHPHIVIKLCLLALIRVERCSTP